MLPFDGTVELVLHQTDHHDVYAHPGASPEMVRLWAHGKKPIHDPDVSVQDILDRDGPSPRHVETILLSGTPEDVNADVAVCKTLDGRYWAEATGHVIDTFMGVYDDLETLWMRIETTDFNTAL